GEVSCAECRRLKIKCDKQIPCQSCVRRGCSALCPNGALATGQGTRFVLAATEHLHRKIARMGERIRMLEDALTALHASKGGADGAVHPLLVDGEDFSVGADDALPPPPSASPDVIDAFGTLSISDHGISRFFGPTGGCEVCTVFVHSPRTRSPYATSLMSPSDSQSPSTLFSSSAFPLTPMGPPHVIHALVTSHLPPRAHANTLVRSYFSELAWLFRGVTRGQVGDMLRGVYAAYGSRHTSGSPDGGADYTGPHDLALLFMVFAAGALVQPPAHGGEEDDAHRQQVAAEAEHLHQIARAALALQPVLEKPSLVTIQALHLLSIYTALASPPTGHARHKGGEEDGETSMEMTWSLITLAAHLSQTIGLHRDSERWGLSTKMVQRRRILFWDLFVADVWQSLNTGRPPSFSLAYIDCSFPTYENAKAKDGICASLSFLFLWQFRFAAECVADVTARTLTAEAPGYATIMELDRKVREFPLPPLDDASPNDVGASLQRCVLEHIRETGTLFADSFTGIFFAQAIIEQPVNPLKSTYAPSFLAAYRASATILKSVREQFAVMPNACARFWTMWTFAFSAAVVFGTVVTRGPRSPLAAAAMTELEQACVLFSKAAVYSRRATKALPILTKLGEKARLALAAAQNDPSGGDNSGLLWNMTGVLGPGGLPVKVKKEEADDELSIFAGHTRFVSGQVQRGQQSALAFPVQQQQPPQHHQQQQQQVQVRQQQQRPQGQIQDEMQYGSYDAERQRQYPAQYPAQQPPPPRQRQLSMPSSSSFHGADDMGRPTRMQHTHQHQQHQFYMPGGVRMQQSIPPPPSAPYAWPVDSYEFDAEAQPQHPHPHQQQQHHPHYQHSQQQPHHEYGHDQGHNRGMYAHPQHAAAYQARNAELAQLGLAARDSRLDERWSTFMEDSGLLEGIDFRAR
ncbi:fungal-specific transcription factor domain-containing protein, partial [Mycena albidolilacea]